jgi:hypothetical protein
MFHSFASPEIALVIVAISFQATHDIYAVGPFLKCSQKMYDINLSGTGKSDDFNVCRIIEPHGTCQVRCRIPSIITTKC